MSLGVAVILVLSPAGVKLRPTGASGVDDGSTTGLQTEPA